MTKRILLALLLLGANMAASLAQPFSKTVVSPNKSIQATLILNEKGEASYKIRFQGKDVIGQSRLGLRLRGYDLTTGLKRISDSKSSEKNSWKPVWGEVDEIKNEYKTITLKLVSAEGLRFDIVFRVYDDGVGFRYEFPKKDKTSEIVVLDELTEFQMTADYTALWAPSDWDSNEHTYTKSKISEIDATKHLTDIEPFVQHITNVHAVQTPVTLQGQSGFCMSIADAALVDYGAMHLEFDRTTRTFKSFIIPTADSTVKSINKLPFHTPWRAILLSPDAGGLLTNHLILNLNEPCKIKGDLSWIKPQKYVGIWWELHVGKSGWNYLDKDGKPTGKHGATTENVKHYIDFAAQNGFAGVLVEGWFEGWEDWFNVMRPEIFEFTKPYPDYDISEISRYAKEKGVKIIVHNETGSAIRSYERQMDAAYDYYLKYGFNAIKTGYVGFIQPKGEWHDGQEMINHYNEVLRRTAEKHIMVVAHEPVRPSGLQRTWPNFMASEAARGQEFNAWSKGNDPSHELSLIFTRLLGGPMDYTPGIFQMELNQFDKAKKDRVRTTVAKQLALYVTLYSPVQMAADLPENYEKRSDVFQFIRDVPTDWSDTKILNAAIGDYVTTARRQKNSDNWFIGSMTDETPRQFKAKLDFLDAGKNYEATIYEDGKDAHYLDNPYPVNIRKLNVRKGQTLAINLADGGGCAISIKAVK
ncbi:MAG: glycoside hydrolase family 97 protein [Phycisphaerae bacterium]|nr:glycoside hydrolase family 97 protein [Saprospiraceae bacterium]